MYFKALVQKPMEFYEKNFDKNTYQHIQQGIKCYDLYNVNYTKCMVLYIFFNMKYIISETDSKTKHAML